MKEPFIRKNDESSVLHLLGWEPFGIISGITTRIGGYSNSPYLSLNMGFHVNDDRNKVEKNYKLMEDKLSIPLSNWVSGKQVHQTTIVTIDEKQVQKGHFRPGSFQVECDGFLTIEPNILLTCVFADCVPLFFMSQNTNWLGIAHAGWRGTVNGIGQEMVKLMVTKGIQLTDIYVAIGPCISKEHYEVDDNVIQHIPKNFHQDCVTKVKDEHYLLDLKQLNKLLLLDAGILEANIQTSHYCTFADEDLFYSYRRDKGKTGRMMAFIGRHR
jgi:polyphenol oxidase